MHARIPIKPAPPAEPGPRYVLPFQPRHLPSVRWPIVVLGSGAAGASAAIAAAAEGHEVVVLRKPPAAESNTRWAQGGIAAAVGPDDDVALHAADTLTVGCGLADPVVVEFITSRAPEAIRWLERLGVHFDQTMRGSRRELTLEGGHSVQRVLSAGGDATGKAIQECLESTLRARSWITVRDDLQAVDLLVVDRRCVGVLALAPRGERLMILAGSTILATGAVGQIYRETTNPTVATGDGIAMAYRAGAALLDLEFLQFHPTTLYIAGAARVLISEAVRGAGATLVDREGNRVMEGRHPNLDLAPRDVVSRAILQRMVETKDTHVYLDASRVADVKERFPQIALMCEAFGIDIASDPIPVRPGAHYMIGGVQTDLRARTTLPGLYACGEVAATGLHGANRLASNSLLEALVMGRIAGEMAARNAVFPDASALAGLEGEASDVPGPAWGEAKLNLDDMLYSLKALMWRQAGLFREAYALRDAGKKILFWESVLSSRPSPDPKYAELANMLAVARLVCHAALYREESRGTHFRRDFAATNDEEWKVRVRLERES